MLTLHAGKFILGYTVNLGNYVIHLYVSKSLWPFHLHLVRLDNGYCNRS